MTEDWSDSESVQETGPQRSERHTLRDRSNTSGNTTGVRRSRHSSQGDRHNEIEHISYRYRYSPAPPPERHVRFQSRTQPTSSYSPTRDQPPTRPHQAAENIPITNDRRHVHSNRNIERYSPPPPPRPRHRSPPPLRTNFSPLRRPRSQYIDHGRFSSPPRTRHSDFPRRTPSPDGRHYEVFDRSYSPPRYESSLPPRQYFSRPNLSHRNHPPLTLGSAANRRGYSYYDAPRPRDMEGQRSRSGRRDDSDPIIIQMRAPKQRIIVQEPPEPAPTLFAQGHRDTTVPLEDIKGVLNQQKAFQKQITDLENELKRLEHNERIRNRVQHVNQVRTHGPKTIL